MNRSLQFMHTKRNTIFYTYIVVISGILIQSLALNLKPYCPPGVAQMCDSEALHKRYTKKGMKTSPFLASKKRKFLDFFPCHEEGERFQFYENILTLFQLKTNSTVRKTCHFKGIRASVPFSEYFTLTGDTKTSIQKMEH